MVDRLIEGYRGSLSDVLGVLVSGPIETDDGDRWSVSLLDADANDVGTRIYFDDVEVANESARRVAGSCGLALVMTIGGAK